MTDISWVGSVIRVGMEGEGLQLANPKPRQSLASALHSKLPAQQRPSAVEEVPLPSLRFPVFVASVLTPQHPPMY